MSEIIIVAGDLAVGKSKLAKKLSTHLNIPYFNKENIKELLGDEIEYTKPEENRKLSNVAIELLLHILERVTMVRSSVILEANFHKAELEKIKRQCEFNDMKVTLLYLTADIDILYERLLYRELYQNRHPVHLTHPLRSIEEFEEYVMKWRNEEEVLPRHVIDVSNCTREVVFAKALEVLESLN
ncbi:MAG TPA: hypothetical protein VJZ05_04315 [Bacilli bacterium]|jgi:predicted kinase|nr:hypothetical protein [Bacilli bacterium]MDD4344977.1 hypothetical protein [Bacilli bacterium]MDD4521154.1 hypothetical protein [Bacilli bacterium]MDY0399921.1 hypothetical protein [Bacilli bacterium]HKM11560.1 hypothetical protein [Bacilli bacterium]